VTAALELPTAGLPTAGAVDPATLAALRVRGRVVEVAASLLASLDYTGAAAGLPLAAQVYLSRLRHAVKLAIHPANAIPPAVPIPSAVPASTTADVAVAVARWAAAQPWTQPDQGPPGFVYLLCFRDPTTGEHRPLRGNGCRGQYAGHYWGWTDDLVRRVVREHRNPRWAGPGRLVQVALAAGLAFELAYVEYPATRGRERRLKNQGGATRRCPLCRGTAGPLDPFQVAAAASDPTTGRRR
jgi:hypothetical protein